MKLLRTHFYAAPFVFLALACSDSSTPAPEQAPSVDPSSDGSGATDTGAPLDAGLDKPDARVAEAHAADASTAAKPATGTAHVDAGPGLDAGSGVEAGTAVASGRDAGSASAPDAGSAPATAPDAGAPMPTQSSVLKPKCVKTASQVMIIGDSYINWITHTFGDDMAKEAGGQRWRMEAVGGYSMGSGGIGLIPVEYDESIAKDPDCHTILMDGGGNDVLVADSDIDPNRDCLTAQSPMLPQCQTIIDKAIAAADALLRKASVAGIRDVVYFFYPHVPMGTLLGGESPNAVLDFAAPQVRKFCDGVEAETQGKTRCTFIDMVPVFQGHDDWFVDGDIHENSMGSVAMAAKIWSVMKDKCIAQPASSGCCEE